MLHKKMLMALLPLALAGSMTVPGFAAEAIPAQQADLSLKPVVSDQNLSPVQNSFWRSMSKKEPAVSTLPWTTPM